MNTLHNHTESHDLINIDPFFNTTEWAIDSQECLPHPQPLLLKVFRFIEEHYKEAISLRDVAVAVSRSPAYLTDLVRKKTGKTVLSWIVERRMTEARRLLLETSRTIEWISEAVGYFDKRHFSRQFLRHHGTNPQAWRRTHQSWSIPLSQIHELQEVIPNHVITYRAMNMTNGEAQRLEACVQEIFTILYKDYYADMESENLRLVDEQYLQLITNKIPLNA